MPRSYRYHLAHTALELCTLGRRPRDAEAVKAIGKKPLHDLERRCLGGHLKRPHTKSRGVSRVDALDDAQVDALDRLAYRARVVAREQQQRALLVVCISRRACDTSSYSAQQVRAARGRNLHERERRRRPRTRWSPARRHQSRRCACAQSESVARTDTSGPFGLVKCHWREVPTGLWLQSASFHGTRVEGPMFLKKVDDEHTPKGNEDAAELQKMLASCMVNRQVLCCVAGVLIGIPISIQRKSYKPFAVLGVLGSFVDYSIPYTTDCRMIHNAMQLALQQEREREAAGGAPSIRSTSQ